MIRLSAGPSTLQANIMCIAGLPEAIAARLLEDLHNAMERPTVHSGHELGFDSIRIESQGTIKHNKILPFLRKMEMRTIIGICNLNFSQKPNT